MTSKIFDICVVGGGPAGALFSTLMAKEGFSVLLLEATEQPKRKVCGEYLCPKGVKLLSESGLDKLFSNMRPIRGMRLFSPDGTNVETDFPAAEHGYALRRDLFDKELLKEAESAGAVLKRGLRVEQFYRVGSYWQIQSGEQTFRSRLLVGADGRQSFISKQLKNDIVLRKKRVAIHVNIATNGSTSDHGEMHILKGGRYIGINPTGDNEWNLSLVCDADKLTGEEEPAQMLAVALAESEELKHRFLPLKNDTVKATYPISHTVKALSGEGWVLIGDAAGFLDPLTGEGIYQALLSAKILHKHVKEAFSTSLFNFDTSLAAYSKEFRRSISEKKRLNLVFQWLIKQEWLCNIVGHFLCKRKSKADIFIGIIGNLMSPSEGIIRIIL